MDPRPRRPRRGSDFLDSPIRRPDAGRVLTSLTTLASLFGGVGLLYIPSIALFMWAASHTEPAIAP